MKILSKLQLILGCQKLQICSKNFRFEYRIKLVKFQVNQPKMDKDKLEEDMKKSLGFSRGSRISYRSEKLMELSVLREKLERQRIQLEEELKELRTNKLMQRRASADF